MDGAKGVFPQQCQAFSASILIGILPPILPPPPARDTHAQQLKCQTVVKKREKKRKQVPYVAHEFEIFYNMAGDTRP